MWHSNTNLPRLPFDAERIDERNYINHLPNLGNVDLGDLNPYGPALVEALVGQIQGNAQNNPIRVFAMNMWGDRGFENREFVDLLVAFAGWVYVTCSQQRGADINRVIQGESGPFVDAACGNLLNAFQDLWGYVPDTQEANAVIQQQQNEWQRITYQLRSVQRNMQQQQGGWQQGGRNMGQGGGRQAGGLGFNQRGGGFQGQQRVDVSTLRPSWEQNQPQQRQPAGPGMRGAGFNRGPSPATTTPRPTQTPQAQVQPQQVSGYSALKNVIADEPVPPRQTQIEVPEKQNEERTSDRVNMDKGRYMVPAYQSKYQPAYTPEMMPMVYDRNDNILFYVMDPEGTPTEEVIMDKMTIVEGGRKVDYLEHELDEKLRRIYRVNMSTFAREIEVTPVRGLIPNKKGTIAIQPTEELREELNAADAPRQLVKPIQASSLERAMFLARMEKDRLMLETDDYLEFQVEEVKDGKVFKGALQHLLALNRCKTFAEFHALLDNQYKNDMAMDDELYHFINLRMTENFNRFLAKQMFMEINVDSFMDDYPDFPDYCAKKFGELMRDKVLEAAPEIIARSVSVLQSDGLSMFLHPLGEEERKQLFEPAVFCDRYSVTHLPWSMYDMEKHWRLEGVVTQSSAKQLHDALTAVFARTQTNGCFVHLLITNDDRVIYAYKSAVTKSDFMITTEPPNFMRLTMERGNMF
jgi:hypothetical protein